MTATKYDNADADAPLTYQWYSSTTNSNQSGTAITGATGPVYTPTLGSFGTTYYYCVVGNTVKGEKYTTTSNVAAVDYTKGVIATIQATGTPLTYNGNAQGPTYTVKDSKGQVVAAEEYNLTGDKQTDAGSYTTTATAKANGHYTGSASVNWAIAQAEIDTSNWADWTADPTYDGSEKTVTLTVPSDMASLVEVGSYTGNKGTDVGEYTAVATLSLKDSKNYKFATGSGVVNHTWKILQAANLPAGIIDKEVNYGDTTVKSIAANEITYNEKVVAGLAIEKVEIASDTDNILDSNSVTVANGAAQFALKDRLTENDANKFATITITGTSKNYKTVTATVKVTLIDKEGVKESNISVASRTMTYNGEAQGFTDADVTTTNAFTGAVTKKFEYSTDHGNTWSDIVPVNAGHYKVKVTCETLTQRGIKEVEYTIDPATLTVKSATVADKVYDGTDAANVTNVVFEGLIGNETLSADDYTISEAKFASANVGEDIKVTFKVMLNDSVKNYTLSKDSGETVGKITKKEITPVITLSADSFVFTGNEIKPAVTVKYTDGGNEKTLADSEYTVAYSNNVNVGNDTETPTVTVTLKENSNYAFADGTVTTKEFTIMKAAAPVFAEIHKVYKEATATADSVDLPEIPGGASYAVGTVTDNDSILNGRPTTADGKLSFELNASGEKGQTAMIPVTISSRNYKDATVNVVITLTDKDVPVVTVEDITKVYDNKELTLSDIKGTAKIDETEVEGDWSFVGSGSDVKNASPMPYVVTVKFTPNDENTYAAVEATMNVTINKAKHNVSVDCTKFTVSGKTLADAVLTVTPSDVGTVAWNDSADTALEAGKAYGWTFTPNDTTNYEVETGTLTPYTSGNDGNGGGGGGGAVSTEKPGTTTLPDGSVVTTTQNSDGSTSTKTEAPNGTTTVEVKKPDGSSNTTTQTKDGSSSVVNTDTNGKTTAEVKLSAAVSGSETATTLPMPKVQAASDSGSAPTVTVTTADNKPAKVEIPVSNVKTGTVAVLVKEDGTEKVIKTSVPTENGVVLTVNSGDSVKIVDKSKSFTDTVNHWGEGSVQFVASRELFVGTSDTEFSPNANMTRGMMMTVLARFEDVNTDGGSTWYDKGVSWAMDNALSDGTNPNMNITREQLVTILYRYSKANGADTSATTNLGGFTDAHHVSDWAKEAMEWAVRNGIILGANDGRIMPKENATRAQVAAVIERYAQKFVA